MDTTVKLNTTVKAIDESSRVLRFIGSTPTPDRSEDVIELAGWKLDNYLKNPIMLWAHRADMPPIAKARSVYVDERAKALVFDMEFPTIEQLSSDPANPSEHALFVDTIYRMYKAGLMNAVSVGFRGIEAAYRDDQKDKPQYARGTRFAKQELLELSAVPVPANPEALVTARSISGINTKGLEIVHNLISPEESNMDIKAMQAEIVELKAEVAALKAKSTDGVETVEKAGRKLSKASMDKLKACGGKIKEAAEIIEAMVSDGVLVDDDGTSDGVEKPKADDVPVKKEIDLAALTVEEANEIIRNSAESH